MNNTQWEQIQTLFHQAADLPADEQRPFVEREGRGDESLVSQVLALLTEDARSDGLFDRGMARAAYDLFEGATPSFQPKEFGPYRLIRPLGEGGMGVVYLAEREDLGFPVAIKILRDAWLSPARRERFASEQRMLAQLLHPSIARLYDANTLADGTPWFVMEYVEGVPLTEHCREKNCSLVQRLELFRSVCEAVQYAHAHGVIHRDLKPSNILVKEDGSVRLLDFGIAKQLTSLQGTVDQTRTGLRLMTPAYASPEQIRGEPMGIRADVYSLGVILYELLTGHLPFDPSHRSPGEAEAAILDSEAERPSAVMGKVVEASASAWSDLDVLCLMGMRKQAERRYQSVEGLIRDVDHYLHNQPLEARPDTWRYRTRKFVLRRRRPVAAAGLVFVTIVALVVFFTLRLTKARNAALAQMARTERIQQFMLNLFQGGDASAGPTDSLRVVTMLARGVQEARSLDKEPEVQAEFYQTLGDIYLNEGQLVQADSLLHLALDKRKTFLGGDHPDVAKTLLSVALLRARQGKFKEGEQLARGALAIDQRHLPAGDPATARARSMLGQVLEDRGAYKDAIAMLEQAVREQSNSAAPAGDLAASLTELANCEFYLDHYDRSQALNRRVLELERKLHGSRHPLVADTLINLGSIHSNQGNNKEAETEYRQALEIYRNWYGGTHPEVASSLTALGQALNREGRLNEAEENLKQALAIQEQVYGPVHHRVALALNELARVEMGLGRLNEAEAQYRRAGTIYQALYSENHYYVALAIANLASVYQQRKQYREAERLYRDALARATKSLPTGHRQIGIIEVRLGRTLLRMGRYADAEPHARAGYEILKLRAASSEGALQASRTDLATIYEQLGEPKRAAEFR